MLEILAIPDVRERIAPITIERYHRMIDLGVFADWNVELLNGVLVEKMSKSALHMFVIDCLLELLQQHCPKSDYLVRQEGAITIGDSEPEPDVSAVLGARSQFKNTKPNTAQFVAEVAISSLAIDRAKAPTYAQAGIPEYWIVQPETRATEVYRNPANGEYTEKTEVPAETTLESSALPGFTFNLAETLAE